MQKRLGMFLVSAVLLGVILAGCTPPTRLERDYGTSYQLTRAQQILRFPWAPSSKETDNATAA